MGRVKKLKPVGEIRRVRYLFPRSTSETTIFNYK